MSDVDIVIDIATTNVRNVYNLSNALQQMNRVVAGAINPMKNLDARSKALSQAIGSTDGSLKAHAKSVSELSRNNAVLTNELTRVRNEIKGLGTSYKYATGSSREWRAQSLKDLKAYEAGLKQVRIRALTEDLKSLSQEQKRLGKDAQFVGRSLIIGLTTPIMMFSRYALQSLVSVDKEFVRLNKVLESVAPNLEMAAQKMGIDLGSATAQQNARLVEMVDNFQKLEKALTNTSMKFGLSKNIAVGLAGEFAELGIQSTEAIAKITELTAATEKLGDMDIGNAKDLVQSLYFQAIRAMQQSGESKNLSAFERESRAIGAATAQLNMFNMVENTTALTLRDLGDAFPEVAAAATSFGLSMTETAGLLAPMKAAGFEIGASANSIKVSLQRITAPTKQNQELFKDLTKEYKLNFDLIQGTGVDAIQQLINAYNTLSKSAAGQEGIMEFFAKVFGVRQGPRMEVAIAQAAEFDRTLKDVSISTDRAEKRIQKFANEIIASSNAANKGTIPLINSYKDIAVVARIATAAIDPKKGFAVVEGYGAVTQKQIDEARKVRDQIGKTLLSESQKTGEDLIGQVATETGRAMIVQLAGATSAAAVADRELKTALGSLDVQIKIMRNSFKMMATEILKQVAPAIKKLSEFATRLYESFSKLNPEQKKLLSTLVLGLAGATAAVGPLVFIFGQFRLAIGTAGKVLFGFLPGLKTLSVEALAAKSGMLNLRNGLIAVGDTVYNNNTRFATFIATLSSGEGPVGKLARKFGLLTGALKETTTAQTALTTEVYAKQAERQLLPSTGRGAGRTFLPRSLTIGTTDPITGGPLGEIRAIKRFRGGFQDIQDPTRAVPRAAQRAFAQEEFFMRAGAGLTGAPGSARYGIRDVNLRRGTSGIRRFVPRRVTTTRTLSAELVGEAIAMRQNAFQDAGITRTRAGNLMRGGRQITEDRALTIARGGARGAIAGAVQTAQTKGAAAVATITGAPAAAASKYSAALAASRAEVTKLRTASLAFGNSSPGVFAKARAAVMGFAKSFTFVNRAMMLMKAAFIGTGIGLAILAVAAIVYLVAKNWEEFQKKIQPAMEAFKGAFDAVKEGLLALIQPFVDLFASISGGSGDSKSQIDGIAMAVNALAKVVQFLANVFKFVFQAIGKIIRYFLGSFVAIFRGIADIVKGFKKMFTGDFLGGLKQVFGGIAKAAYGLLGPFRFVFDFILNGWILIAKAGSKLLGWIPGIGGKIKGAVKGLEALKGFFKGSANIKASVKVEKTKIKKEDIDTDPAQEKIANATGEGIEEGAAKGAAQLAKVLASRLKNLKKELQEEIVNRVKGAMDDVVTAITDSLKNQKEASLKVYDDQIDKINALKKKEEELTKTKEYENRKREIEEKRALNALNSQRAYELAIYEGRIDDAREISFERQKSEQESSKELEDLNSSREKDLQEASRQTLIDSINDAKKAAGEYFDDMIKKFTESAKKITEFPPTTAQEFNDQLNALKDVAINAANSMGTSFSGSFTGILGNLGVDSEGPLTTALGKIGEVIANNNPFGPNGVWQTAIDESINALTKKYDGLYNTLTTVIDTKSGAFKRLWESYNKYQTLVDAEQGGAAGGGGGGAPGGAPGGGGAGSTTAQPGYYYRSKEKGQKTWSSWVGPRKLDEINAIKPILSKTGLFEFKFANYNPGIVNVGVGPGNATSNLQAVLRAVGGVIPYGQGGPTNGPVQQGIPAILHGGEYVVRNSAVKKYGWGMMQQINQGTYKPKPFAVGGMIDRRRAVSDRALPEFAWQQANGGFTEKYWDRVGSWETGGGKSPNLRHSNKKFAGAYGLTKDNWLDYGGLDFATSADKASKIQQLVIANRKAAFGYINKIMPNPGMPSGAMQLMYPTGTGGWTTIGKFGKVDEPFNIKDSFASAEARKMYLDKRSKNYFRGTGTAGTSGYRPPHERAIQMYGYNPLVVPRSKSIANQEFIPLSDLNSLISSGQYPSLAKGGIVDESRRNKIGLTNIKAKSNKIRDAIANPAKFAASSNVGLQKYTSDILSGESGGLRTAANAATEAKRMEEYNKWYNKVARGIAYVSPLGGYKAAMEFATGKDLDAAAGSGKTQSRFSSGLELAAIATGYFAGDKLLRLAAKTRPVQAIGRGIKAIGRNAIVKPAKMAGSGLSYIAKGTKGFLDSFNVIPNIMVGTKKEPFITQMGARILENVNASRLARTSRNTPWTGFADEWLPVPPGGVRRPSLGGGWKGFIEQEAAAARSASEIGAFIEMPKISAPSISIPKSAGSAGNPELMRANILANIEASAAARKSRNLKYPYSSLNYAKRQIAGEERNRALNETLTSLKYWFFGEFNPTELRRMIHSNLAYTSAPSEVSEKMEFIYLFDKALEAWSGFARNVATDFPEETKFGRLPRFDSNEINAGSPGGSLYFDYFYEIINKIIKGDGLYPTEYSLPLMRSFAEVINTQMAISLKAPKLPGINQFIDDLSYLIPPMEPVGTKPRFPRFPKSVIGGKILPYSESATPLRDANVYSLPSFFTNVPYSQLPSEFTMYGSQRSLSRSTSRAYPYTDIKNKGTHWLDFLTSEKLTAVVRERLQANLARNYELPQGKLTFAQMQNVSKLYPRRSSNWGKQLEFEKFIDEQIKPLWDLMASKPNNKDLIQNIINARIAKGRSMIFGNADVAGKKSIFGMTAAEKTYANWEQYKESLRSLSRGDMSILLKMWEEISFSRFGDDIDPQGLPLKDFLDIITRKPADYLIKGDPLGPSNNLQDLLSRDTYNTPNIAISVLRRLTDVSRKYPNNLDINTYGDLLQTLSISGYSTGRSISEGVEGIKEIAISGMYAAGYNVPSRGGALKGTALYDDAAAAIWPLLNFFYTPSFRALRSGSTSPYSANLAAKLMEMMQRVGYTVDPFVREGENTIGFATSDPISAIVDNLANVLFNSIKSHVVGKNQAILNPSGFQIDDANAIKMTNELISDLFGFRIDKTEVNQLVNYGSGFFEYSPNYIDYLKAGRGNIMRGPARPGFPSLEDQVRTLLRMKPKSGEDQLKRAKNIIQNRFNGGRIRGFANGGIVPNFDSTAVPAILHGGEYVINSKAVKNIGFAALEAMNNMRFSKPNSPSYAGPVSPQSSSTSTVHIYVDNFIGQKDWFESMMKDYNVNVVPQNQKAAGLENRTVRTYSGINRGM